MKKSILPFLASILVYTAAFAGDPIDLAVFGPLTGEGSVCLLPPHNVQNTIAWATNMVLANGNILAAQNGMNYLVVNFIGGATTNSPTNLVSYVKRDNIIYRPVQAVKEPRKGLIVCNTNDVPVNLSFGSPAVVGKGIQLPATNGSLVLYGPGVPQDALFVISAATGAVITAQEW